MEHGGRRSLRSSLPAAPSLVMFARAALIGAVLAVSVTATYIRGNDIHTSASVDDDAASTSRLTTARSTMPKRSSSSMVKVRTYDGPRLDMQSLVPAIPPIDERMCEKWVVVSSVRQPTQAVRQVAAMDDWCVVVVGGKHGPREYSLPGVTYLSPEDQERLPYRIGGKLPRNHLGRKNMGYIYAVHHGAKVIYDLDDGNALMAPEEGIPHAEEGQGLPRGRIADSNCGVVFNPYPCFGWATTALPRGCPTCAVEHQQSSACPLAGETTSASRRLGIVHAVVSDGIHVGAGRSVRESRDQTPAAVDEGSRDAENELIIASGTSFAPYSAQATLHFERAFWGLLIPITVDERVSDIWRSYFTQTLLPFVGAAVAFAPSWTAQAAGESDSTVHFPERDLLREEAGHLADFLAEVRRQVMTDATSETSLAAVAHRVEALTITMYEHGIIESADVDLSCAWLQDLISVGYFGDDFADQSPVPATSSGATTHYTSLMRQLNEIDIVAEDVPKVVLVIAVVSIRPDRRKAIRETWLAWADDRVVVRFFTEAPQGADGAADREAASELEREAETYGDLVIVDIDRGMNFARKLVEAMKWITARYTFDYFLRLDDDYFLCLQRLVDELEITRVQEDSQPPEYLAQNTQPALYVGHRYCMPHGSRIDEAYLLLSNELVGRILSTPDLQCGGHAGITAGWWFRAGGQVNPHYDVEWVHDFRLDHFGKWLQTEEKGGAPLDAYPSVCEKRVGIHRAYVAEMRELWEAAKERSGSGARGLFRYVDDGHCPQVKLGANDDAMRKDHGQACDSFMRATKRIHCGAEGC